MGDLAYDEGQDAFVPYHDLLCTRASAQTRDLTRQAALAVCRAADRLLALLEAAHSHPKEAVPGPARGSASGDRW